MYIEILNALIKSKTSECMRECNIDIAFEIIKYILPSNDI